VTLRRYVCRAGVIHCISPFHAVSMPVRGSVPGTGNTLSRWTPNCRRWRLARATAPRFACTHSTNIAHTFLHTGSFHHTAYSGLWFTNRQTPAAFCASNCLLHALLYIYHNPLLPKHSFCYSPGRRMVPHATSGTVHWLWRLCMNMTVAPAVLYSASWRRALFADTYRWRHMPFAPYTRGASLNPPPYQHDTNCTS